MNERLYERKFYHDLLNLASSTRGITEVIRDVDQKTSEEMLALLGNISETMIETINARRQYCGLIANDLKPTLSSVDCEKLLKRLTVIYTRHTLAAKKSVTAALTEKPDPSQKILLNLDKDILQGALGYGIRTALEAVAPGQTITLGLQAEKTSSTKRVTFSITFPVLISETDKGRIFKAPEGDETALTGLSAYIFYRLITEILKGSVTYTTLGNSTTLIASFEETPGAN
jgi:hypothetical protein